MPGQLGEQSGDSYIAGAIAQGDFSRLEKNWLFWCFCVVMCTRQEVTLCMWYIIACLILFPSYYFYNTLGYMYQCFSQ